MKLRTTTNDNDELQTPPDDPAVSKDFLIGWNDANFQEIQNLKREKLTLHKIVNKKE